MTAQSPYAQPPGGGPAASSTERTWAWVSHAGCFVGVWLAMGVLVPLVILLAKGKDSPFVRRHAVESLNFQISTLIYGAACFVLALVVIGLVLAVVLVVFYVVVVVLATMKAARGEEYRYPLTIRLVH